MKKILIIGTGIILLLLIVLVPIGIAHDYGFKFEAIKAQTPAETPEEIEAKKTLEMEKLEKVTSLVDSEEFLGGFTTGGTVKEIFKNALVIQKFNEKGEEISVVVPISEDVQVTRDGTEIAFEEIKKEDKVFVLLNQMEVILSGCPLKGVYVEVEVPEQV